jgi:lipopolysaccharide heptosyltransferase III
LLVRTDCIYFRGDKPCRFHRLCEGCLEYRPMGTRVLLIKLAARGDVLRTTPLLEAIRKEHDPCHVTWVVGPESKELLEGIDTIDRLIPLDLSAAMGLMVEEFDVVICLDKEPAATGLATRAKAPRKLGFLLDKFGGLIPASPEAAYAYRLGLDDDLKFHGNAKTYQEIVFEACGFPFRGEDYRLALRDADRDFAARVYARLGVGKEERLVGLNLGGGEAFAYKGWRGDGFAELAFLIQSELGARVALLGGPAERERLEATAAACPPGVIRPDLDPSMRRFAALLERCDVVVTGDTLGLHLALALRRKVVVVFGSTCAAEIELYGRGEKIVPKVDCHPCYLKTCDKTKTCVDSISAAEVFQALKRTWSPGA